MNADFAHAHMPDDAWFPTAPIDVPRGSTYERVDVTAPETEHSMLEIILRSIDDRLRNIDKRFERVDQRFDRIDQRFEQVDQRFEQVDQRFAAIDLQFCGLTAEVVGLNTRMSRVESGVDTLTACVRGLGERIACVEESVRGLNHMRTEITRVGERTDELVSRVSGLAQRIQFMPSWKFLGIAAAGTFATTASTVTWLSQGGANTISRWFE
ncbi:MAG TPA: hypothetical protein VGN46_01520 [Luteibacter sp.]|uniref:hypothetical protein n=1 Tax=Luteibacter sp. TaxID=1886636 RepID=UPI002F420F75